VSQIENNAIIFRDLSYYLIRKPCYPDENCAMPPRLRCFVCFLDFKIYSGIVWSSLL